MYLSIRSTGFPEGRPSEADAVRALRAGLDAGCTFLDTANVYCFDDGDLGHNERLVAKALAAHADRASVIDGTKGGLARPNGAWTRNARPDALVVACEQSLRALGTERIDLYQLHAPDPDVPFAESVGALARLREQGKIRRVGLSNVSATEIETARRIVPIATVQNRWSPMHRGPENDGVLDSCTKHGIALLPYSPFGGASGAKGLADLGSLGALAVERGMSPHRLVLSWLLAKSPVVVPIPGIRRAESAKDSVAATPLAAGDVAAFERAIA
jgi:aryl-alcohol dehydrogenase-like predicted oxidoreductase